MLKRHENLKAKNYAEEGDWKTIRGVHVLIGKGGEIKQGPDGMKGKNVKNIGDYPASKSKGGKEESKKEKPEKKVEKPEPKKETKQKKPKSEEEDTYIEDTKKKIDELYDAGKNVEANRLRGELIKHEKLKEHENREAEAIKNNETTRGTPLDENVMDIDKNNPTLEKFLKTGETDGIIYDKENHCQYSIRTNGKNNAVDLNEFNTEESHRGKGAFSKVLGKITKQFPEKKIRIRRIINRGLAQKLTKLGWEKEEHMVGMEGLMTTLVETDELRKERVKGAING